MSASMISLRDVLVGAEKLSWRDALYMSPKEDWNLGSNCIVHDVDDVDEDKEVPDVVEERGFRYVLGIQEIQDIVGNAKLQKNSPTENDLFDAFLFYFKNDAFIIF